MAATNINIRTDSELKTQAQMLFNMLGIDMTTAINMFLKQAVIENAIPFNVQVQDKASVEVLYSAANENNHEKIRLSKSMIDEMLESEDLRSLTGILHCNMSDDEIRAERVRKYECTD
jgi:DNA-damage-inducible protein J